MLKEIRNDSSSKKSDGFKKGVEFIPTSHNKKEKLPFNYIPR
jgi:hypothetical protein